MTEAVFGLLGVVLGGLLTGAVTYMLERRREASNTRAAARLILINFRVAERYIEELADGLPSTQPPNVGWAYNVWLEARPILASALSVHDWDALSAGMAVLEDLGELETTIAKSGGTGTPLVRDNWVETAHLTSRVLTKLAGAHVGYLSVWRRN